MKRYLFALALLVVAATVVAAQPVPLAPVPDSGYSVPRPANPPLLFYRGFFGRLYVVQPCPFCWGTGAVWLSKPGMVAIGRCPACGGRGR